MNRRALLLATLAAAGCTKAELYIPPDLRETVVDNRVRLEGQVCAERASDLASFLKVMLIIDRSNSMLVTDPRNRRVDAVRNLVMRFVDDPATFRLRPGVEFAIESFFGDVLVHTRDARGQPGFSNNGQQVLTSLLAAARVSSNTGYDKALSMAFLILDADMARIPDIARARSRYEVIFLSDGMPFPNNCRGEANAPTAALSAVDRIVSLSAMHRVPIHFSTGFVSDPRMFTAPIVDTCAVPDPFAALSSGGCRGGGNTGQPCHTVADCPDSGPGTSCVPAATIGDQTRALLMAMATRGGGSFTQFANGDAVTLEDFELADARRMYALSALTVANANALPALDHVIPDSDGDGLSDDLELLIGSRPTLADTDVDGVGDGIEWRFRKSGLDPLDPTDARCGPDALGDTDGDGLRDCEELLIGTDRRSVDSDSDGVTDDVEVRAGGNPRSASPLQDSQLDSDSDGGSDFDEQRWHTDPSVNDAGYRAQIAYDYNQAELPITGGQACYDFRVGGVQLASTMAPLSTEARPTPFDKAGANRLLAWFAEAPYDDPKGEKLYRVACIDTRFVAERALKQPASGRYVIPAMRPSSTWAPVPVLKPNDAVCRVSVNSDCGLNSLWCRHEDTGACNCYVPPTVVGDPLDGVLRGPCPLCSDGLDNDGDGQTDYPNDPDCFDSMDDNEDGPGSGGAFDSARPSAFASECSDGRDNDGNGLIDWPDDPGCASAYQGTEGTPSPPPECSDGIDNDGNGLIDYPADPGCTSAANNQESLALKNQVPACSDSVDSDGDGFIDFPADPGCESPFDVDEDGPQTCFFCERVSDNRPGQCDLESGHCRPRNAVVCTTSVDCRGAPCVNGRCKPCLRDADCDSAAGAGDGLCNADKGWCLIAGYTPVSCSTDAACAIPGGSTTEAPTCDVPLGFCPVDRYAGCHDDRDCAPGDLCSDRGFCLGKTFQVQPCDRHTPCASGTCNEELGWCLPTEEADRCHHDDLCPYGDCRAAGYCEQPTFVPPTQLDPAVDCVRPQ